MLILQKLLQIGSPFLLVLEHLVSPPPPILVLPTFLLPDHPLIKLPLLAYMFVDPFVLRLDHFTHLGKLLLMFSPSLHIKLMRVLNLDRSTHPVIVLYGTLCACEISDMVSEAFHAGFVHVFDLGSRLLFAEDVQPMPGLVDFVLYLFQFVPSLDLRDRAADVGLRAVIAMLLVHFH